MKQEYDITIKQSKSYRLSGQIAKWMDRYYLDAVAGLLFEGIGDILTQLLTLPYIYVSAVKIKSLPLTLAVIYNALCDLAIGLVPFYIGNVLDFSRSRTGRISDLLRGSSRATRIPFTR